MALSRRGFLGGLIGGVAAMCGAKKLEQEDECEDVLCNVCGECFDTTDQYGYAYCKNLHPLKDQPVEHTSLSYDSIRGVWTHEDGRPEFDCVPMYGVGFPRPIGWNMNHNLDYFPACTGLAESGMMIDSSRFVVTGSGALDPNAFKVNHCTCAEPDKKHSDARCYACWTCRKCGHFGGCDNVANQLAMEFPLDAPLEVFGLPSDYVFEPYVFESYVAHT